MCEVRVGGLKFLLSCSEIVRAEVVELHGGTTVSTCEVHGFEHVDLLARVFTSEEDGQWIEAVNGFDHRHLLSSTAGHPTLCTY